ncbi:hypothetical protein GCM10017691_04790 [Pseudonocardia petroleophila]|uniref:Uncharacterized protein n=1 Tax=Pseudonocardia petroleophila TaxID=37331 RepID=A0A7G7MKE7_9PSEU|nr:hypothetical protein [Pseudonocardia petroleophila]QNG53258.1 hypothetical protein H6H00_04450 [Pseudonocardia petroleophila]
MTTLRRAAVLAACAILAALLAGLAVLDPFHLRHVQWFVAGTVLLTIVLVTAALAVAVRVFALRLLVLVVGGILAVGWGLTAWLAIGLDDPRSAVVEVASGDRRLVVQEGAAFTIDPVFRVVLRAGAGPFEQESLVWQGDPEGAGPGGVAFRGVDEVEVRTGGCVLVSRIEPVTLAVDPVHRGTAGC